MPLPQLDESHRAERRSWVESANGHPDFPIQNLPFGVFSRDGDRPRGGVAIGEQVLDLAAALDLGLLAGPAAQAAAAPALNRFFALGAGPRRALRRRLAEILDADGPERAAVGRLADRLLHPLETCRLHLPAAIGDYTDFYAGIQHATNVGRLLRPDGDPLLPNYKHLPIGYHGRASSVLPSGQGFRRPAGQLPRSKAPPVFAPSAKLDYELELGLWIGPGNALGEPIPIAEAADHIAGFCLLNDWSARDIQAWEYQPLGPFLAKSFATTLSPWVVTPEALAPFRAPQAARAAGDPALLDYLSDAADQGGGALDIELAVYILTEGMRAKGLPPHRLSLGSARHLYWTPAQLVAHHSSGGCNLNPGDLFGSGTISTPERGGYGSLLELTAGGREPLALPGGETRGFLADGDEIVMTARCRREGFAPIGFGPCRGRVESAVAR